MYMPVQEMDISEINNIETVFRLRMVESHCQDLEPAQVLRANAYCLILELSKISTVPEFQAVEWAGLLISQNSIKRAASPRLTDKLTVLRINDNAAIQTTSWGLSLQPREVKA